MCIETEQEQKQKQMAIVVGAEDENLTVHLIGRFSVCWWRWYKLDQYLMVGVDGGAV